MPMNANDLGSKNLFDVYNAVERNKNNTIGPYADLESSPGIK